MRTNIDIDDELMAQAMQAFGAKTKRETIEIALRDAIQIRRQEAILQLEGIGWDGDLDEMRTDKPRPQYG